ncbi:MAG TPA: TIGR02300 family protein [Alphaproteobacteria bacterium]
MAKPEWGLKRTCQSCGAHFYDMRRDPAVCPKCGTEFDPEAVLKSKRAKPTERIAPAEIPEADDQLESIADDELIDADEGEEEEVIEDTSELGEDDEDVADVIENVDEDGER